MAVILSSPERERLSSRGKCDASANSKRNASLIVVLQPPRSSIRRVLLLVGVARLRLGFELLLLLLLLLLEEEESMSEISVATPPPLLEHTISRMS